MNVNFEAAAKACVSIEKKITGFWSSLAMAALDFSVKARGEDGSVIATYAGVEAKDAVGKEFKTNETEYKAATKRALSEFGAYRSAKSVILQAMELDVPLFEDGKVRGKTEVEKAIAAVKEDNTSAKRTIDKIKGALDMVNKLVDSDKSDMEHADYVAATLLARDLTDKLVALATASGK